MLVAEVQTTSDTTFRLYDWGRVDRPLHIDEALACMDFAPPRRRVEPVTIDAGDVRTERLVDTPAFSIERLVAVRPTRLDVPNSGRPIVLVTLEGRASIETPDGSIPAIPGRALLVPAATGTARLEMDCAAVVLRVDVPGPIDHIIDDGPAMASA